MNNFKPVVIRKVSKTKDGNCRINIDTHHMSQLRFFVRVINSHKSGDMIGDVSEVYDKLLDFCNEISGQFETLKGGYPYE